MNNNKNGIVYSVYADLKYKYMCGDIVGSLAEITEFQL